MSETSFLTKTERDANDTFRTSITEPESSHKLSVGRGRWPSKNAMGHLRYACQEAKCRPQRCGCQLEQWQLSWGLA